ncbi:MAG: hypothetical protein PHP04_12700 [Bacteroidales bacterium]|nr:hypothetical protein [Bacteroidales bacterium]HNW74258.1 hypothetical protein [Bacteroidales bacterium]
MNSTSCFLWAPVTANQRGQITKFDPGNGLTSQRAYDAKGFPWGIMTKNKSTNAIIHSICYDNQGNYNMATNSQDNVVERLDLDPWVCNNRYDLNNRHYSCEN